MSTHLILASRRRRARSLDLNPGVLLVCTLVVLTALSVKGPTGRTVAAATRGSSSASGAMDGTADPPPNAPQSRMNELQNLATGEEDKDDPGTARIEPITAGFVAAPVPQAPSPTRPQGITIPASGPKDSEAAPVPPLIGAARVTLRPHGFTPAAFTGPAGLFLLAFDNRSGLRNITLRLDQIGGIRLREVQLPLERLHWRGLLTLGPGSYTLTEADHPGWICSITITAP